jgi:hypothetical protein
MAGVSLITLFGVAIAFAALGFLTHEFGHLLLGTLFGGDPFFDQYTLAAIPTRTDFKSPRAMAGWQIRLTGGFVYIFPVLAGLGLLLGWPGLIFFGLGGCGISASDLIATYHPEAWKKLTAGEPVTRGDFEG